MHVGPAPLQTPSRTAASQGDRHGPAPDSVYLWPGRRNIAHVRLLSRPREAEVIVRFAGAEDGKRDYLLCVRLFQGGKEVPVELYNWHYSASVGCKFTYIEMGGGREFVAPRLVNETEFDEAQFSIVPWSRRARSNDRDPSAGALGWLTTDSAVLNGLRGEAHVACLTAFAFTEVPV